MGLLEQPEILYTDNHLLVIGKPAGFLSQGDITGDSDVITWCKLYLKETYNKKGNVYAGLVHRLDRPASGVMVIARTSKAASRLTAQWKRRVPVKRYLALVEGKVEGSGSWVDHIVKVDRRASIVSNGHPAGKKAILSYSVISSGDGLSCLDILLETGRPHQIRLQCSSRGFPILGDLRYGSERLFDGRNLALHAYSLELEHPVKLEKMEFIWKKPLLKWEALYPIFQP